MAKTYQCSECGSRWTSPFTPMFCSGTKGCKSKSFVVVDGADATSISTNPFLKLQSTAPTLPSISPSISDGDVFVQKQEFHIVSDDKAKTLSNDTNPPVVTETVSSKSTNLLWRFRSNGEARPARFCPIFDDKKRLFVSVSNTLAMFESDGLSTGKPSWTKSFGGLVRHPVLGPDGNLRIHASDGRLYSVSPNGEETNTPVIVGVPSGWSTPTIDRDGMVWLQLSQGGLTKVAPNGTLPRKPFFRTNRRLDCTGILIDGVFYVGSETGCVMAIDLSNEQGANRWENDDRVRTGWCINSAFALFRSTLIVSSRDDILYGFSTDGDRLWEIAMPGQMIGSPVVDCDGNIFIGLGVHRRGGNVGMLVCVDGRTHRIRWKTPTPAPVESTPVIGEDRTIYFGDNDGNLLGLDIHGSVCWSDKVDTAVRSPGILFDNGRLAFGLDDGSFAVFTCPSPTMSPNGWPKFRGKYSQTGNESIAVAKEICHG